MKIINYFRCIIPIAILAVLLNNYNIYAIVRTDKLNHQNTRHVTVSSRNLQTAAQKLKTLFSGNTGNRNVERRDNQLFNKLQLRDAVEIKLPRPEEASKLTNIDGVRLDSRNKTVYHIEGGILQSQKKPADNMQASQAALFFIEENKELFKLENPSAELVLNREIRDEEGNRHLVYEQYYNGIPIWGKEITVHTGAGNAVYLVNARYSPTPAGLGTEEKISRESAIEIAMESLCRGTQIEQMNENMQIHLNYHGPSAAKYILIEDKMQKAALVWHVEIRPNVIDNWQFFIDAETGEIMEKYNASPSDAPATATAVDLSGTSRTINVLQSTNGYYMLDCSRSMFGGDYQNLSGFVGIYDNKNTDLSNSSNTMPAFSVNNVWSDPAAVSALYNLGYVYEYYKSLHQRNSIDNKGMSIVSIIHVTYNGQSFDNAYWNGSFIVLGDGGSMCGPWAGALDFVAHELTHGVVQYTVNLEYKKQSGALNEAFADWGGAMVDRSNWKLGEAIAKPAWFPSGAVRDMENPHNGAAQGDYAHGWLPANMSEYADLPLDSDNGGVHINLGVINKATSLIGNALGKDKLEKIYYRILKNLYLNKQSQFIDMRLAAIRAASDIYGITSSEVTEVKNAFDAVGIVGDNPTNPDSDLQPVSGDRFIATVNMQGSQTTGYDNSLFITKPVINNPDTDIFHITQTQVYIGSGSCVTVPDNGSMLLFIDSGNNLRGIYPDGSQETVIDNSGVWGSIAISPDGKRLAATSVNEEPLIYLFDLEQGTYNTVELYVPNTSQMPDTESTPLFASTLSWNVSGTILVYDALNYKFDRYGNIIYFWETNVLEPNSRVIYRILPPAQEGLQIGNPSFCHTSEYVLCFDTWDSNSKKHYIYGMNLFSGVLGNIAMFDAQSFNCGFSTYSPDDNAIVFHYYNPSQDSYDLYKMTLLPDKISPSGSPAFLINEMVYPKWFAVGTRPEDVSDNEQISGISMSVQPNPFTEKVYIDLNIDRDCYMTAELYNTAGMKIAVINRGENIMPGVRQLEWNGKDDSGEAQSSGIYFIRIDIWNGKSGFSSYFGKIILNR